MRKFLILPLIALSFNISSCNDDSNEPHNISQFDSNSITLSQTTLNGNWQESENPANTISFNENGFSMSLSKNSAFDKINEECPNQSISVRGNYHFDNSKIYLEGTYQKSDVENSCDKRGNYNLQEFSYEIISEKEIIITNSNLSSTSVTITKN
ncbi:hypothetical protein [Aureibacter tunicatorum]|uniref:Uncharacterized protein n=1 Tax=Aureibacter tunicatorum TaxID=866807 RepID=A0AAE4BRH0_9BACT|nr:hypothetical protein [Aureibacter tunicatorum]MDR6240204.1 hypothetical protein [Aureibacter tunicatorum]BDD05915.1 hypothetical protein AUTU_33980 [Aureibacter tunicatorum]